MSTTVLPDAPASEESSAAKPGWNTLEDQLPEAAKVPFSVAGYVLFVGLVFLLSSFRPLYHTDLWGHLSYGRDLVARGNLPVTEPLMPLSRGMPWVDTAWLSQLVGYGMEMAFGYAGLQGLYAALVAGVAGILAVGLARKTRRFGWGITGAIVYLWLDGFHLGVFRPQLAGSVLFAWLLMRLTSRITRTDQWVIPTVFILWANLHGSFAMGLVLLATFALGRAIDVFRRTGAVTALRRDGRLWQLVMLFQCACLASLINPYGLGLFVEVWQFGKNGNLQDLTEWQPLTLRDTVGQFVAAVAAVLMVLYRLTPRRVAAWEPLLLIGLGFGALHSSRLLTWWSVTAIWALTVHGHSVWQRFRHADRLDAIPAVRTGKWTVVSLGLIWVLFGFSSFGGRVLHGRQVAPERALSSFTPHAAVKYLVEHPPQGQVFNIYEWGDYLGWAGPQGVQVFLNSHAHAVPREVWQHYMAVVQQQSGWEEVLERYSVNTVLVDPLNRTNLIRRLKEDPKWRVDYEDPVAVVFTRRRPI